MKASSSAPKTVSAYIAGYPPTVRAILRKVRATVRKAAPDASEAIKYGLPTLVQNGNVIHYGAFKHHLGFFATPTGHTKFKKELSPYLGGKGSVQFPLDQPIPYALIRRIVKFRVHENAARATNRSR